MVGMYRTTNGTYSIVLYCTLLSMVLYEDVKKVPLVPTSIQDMAILQSAI